jgi:hypothetical protein
MLVFRRVQSAMPARKAMWVRSGLPGTVQPVPANNHIVGFRVIACWLWTNPEAPQSAHQMMNRVGRMARYLLTDIFTLKSTLFVG